MTYLNTHTRTTSPTANEQFQAAGRMPALFGVFMGYIKEADDVQRNGRLRVWIPEFGSAPDNPEGWVIVNYCSPFAGATNVDSASKSNVQSFEGTQTSYGMWMIPPDINNQVLVMFINGDPSRGIWIGCLYNQFMNNMVPGMAGSANNYQYPGKNVPVAEYNKWDQKTTNPDATIKPYEATKFKGLGNQGLITDTDRGVSDSSARREAPSSTFGILTPGPVIDSNATPDNIRRKGGSSFIMDDAVGSESVVLTTKSGAQIKLDETNGFVYLINRDGTAWVQMDSRGNVDIFGAQNVSMRAEKDFNIRADRNVNIEAGQNIYLKAAKDTQTSTTTFTYNVNNIPNNATIPFYKYVGEGAGEGGNIVIQALNNVHQTVKNNMFLTVLNGNLSIQVQKNLQITTVAGKQDYNSAQNINLQTGQDFNVKATGSILEKTSASYNLAASNNVSVSSGSTISLAGTTSIIEQAPIIDLIGSVLIAGSLGSTAGTSVTFGGSIGVVGSVTASTLDSTSLNVSGNSALGVVTASNVTAGLTNSTQPAPTVSPPTFSGSPGTPVTPADAASAATAVKAEIKPLIEKINVLPTWADPVSKFKRNSEAINTTVSWLPTYEPCPEHDKFSLRTVTGYTPKATEGAKTYQGSGGAGSEATSSPVTNADPGANNTDIPPPDTSASAVVKDFNLAAYQCQLKIHEGVKYVSYIDSRGFPTGGIGHLLRTNEITTYPVPSPIAETQVDTWFQSDAAISISGATRLLGTDVWGELTDIRKRACADLCYNLGEAKLAKFVRFLAAMKKGDYNAAGNSLRDSLWFTQVGRRGPNIITMIVSNIDPNGCDRKFPPTN
jgi:lysozyme